MVVAQHWECGKYNHIVHFKMVNFVLREFRLMWHVLKVCVFHILGFCIYYCLKKEFHGGGGRWEERLKTVTFMFINTRFLYN